LKGLLIYKVDVSDSANSGVYKKFKGQLQAYQTLVTQIDSVVINGQNIIKNNSTVLDKIGGTDFINKNIQFFKSLEKGLDFGTYDFIHIRYPFSSPIFNSFLKKVLTINPNIKIFLEIPTFPYDNEFETLKAKAILAVDKMYRKQLDKYIHRIIHYGVETDVFNIQAIPVINGIQYHKPVFASSEKASKLECVAVGKWREWHGLDRVIQGLVGHQDISLTIVGEGLENTALKKKVGNLSLEDQVRFVGNKTGEELELIYQSSHLGIGTLGMHRKGVAIDSALKHREYCLYGLPFILSTKDLGFPASCGFVHYVSSDDRPVNFANVLEFYKSLDVGQEEINLYGKENLSWESCVSKVVACL